MSDVAAMERPPAYEYDPSRIMEMDVEELRISLRQDLPAAFTDKDRADFERSMNLSEKWHTEAGSKWRGGEYTSHPLRVTRRLLDDGITDAPTIIAAPMHDVIEDCSAQILAHYGMPAVAKDRQRRRDMAYALLQVNPLGEIFNKDVVDIVRGASSPVEVMDKKGFTREERNMISIDSVRKSSTRDRRVFWTKNNDLTDNGLTLHRHSEGWPKRKVDNVAVKDHPLLELHMLLMWAEDDPEVSDDVKRAKTAILKRAKTENEAYLLMNRLPIIQLSDVDAYFGTSTALEILNGTTSGREIGEIALAESSRLDLTDEEEQSPEAEKIDLTIEHLRFVSPEAAADLGSGKVSQIVYESFAQLLGQRESAGAFQFILMHWDVTAPRAIVKEMRDNPLPLVFADDELNEDYPAITISSFLESAEAIAEIDLDDPEHGFLGLDKKSQTMHARIHRLVSNMPNSSDE